MDKIKSVYQRSEVGGYVSYPIKFSCKQCGESYNDFKLKLAIFLYGIAFLTGKDDSLSVFTCPRCLKSNLLRVSDINQLFSDLSMFEGQNGSSWPTDLTYHSSVSFSPAQNPALKDFDIPYWNIPLSAVSKDNFTGIITSLQEENSYLFENGYLSSYIFDHDTPIGVMASIWFFNPKEIDKLIQIENESEIRVFPRYYHKMSFYEEYDEFVWNNLLYRKYRDEQKRLAAESFDTLSSVARENDINLDNLIEHNSNILSTEMIDEIYKNSAPSDSDSLNVASDFLHLILSDPDPWDMPSNAMRFYKDLWKFDLPFEENGLPEYQHAIDASEYEIDPLMKRHFDRVGTIKENQNKKSILEFLNENYSSFCEYIIEIAQRNDYAYGSIWPLKKRYVNDLYNYFNEQERDEAKHVFCKEGQTYTIIFNGGKPLRGFRGGGFKYLHYLVANRGKAFSHEELNALDGVDTEFLDSLDSSSNTDSGNSELAKSKKGKLTEYSNDRITTSAAQKLFIEYKRLKENIEAAEQSEDPDRITEAKMAFSKFKTHYQFYFGPGGRIKKFNSGSKTVKDKIAISLKRALKSIEKEDQEVYSHFFESLSPPYSNTLQYGPLKDIDWHCE
jgi:hypothetical protein